ncbi:iron-sulfur cluster-binding domain-containing protein [uncultured Roseibium sp.]|uniref:flavin reductase family protein n=1 Tax=uncultured Roseibium sp. TaxID=1936171 RepID=UPI002630B68A|nr:iron-sulfur cluster-binding domain-containing protein [uncultured Roseibium sp.]
MAHELHKNGADFELHYSCSKKADAGFLEDFDAFPWMDKVSFYFSDQNTRADLDQVLSAYQQGSHVYACGPDRYMTSVMEAAERAGFTDDERHVEYFNVPEVPDYVNHPFTLKLARTGRELEVPAEKSATDVLAENGIPIDIKCSDGICGVCKCGLVSGEVEHRDFVLSKKQREEAVILCQSRAAEAGGVVEVDL